MEETVLKASIREETGKKVKLLRRQGILPAIIYGRGIDPIALSLNEHDANRVLASVSSSHLIKIEIGKNKHNTLVKEKQRHPVTGSILHIDFQEVSLTEKLRAAISLELRGEAPAIKEYNGLLVTQSESIEVECLPQDLPERLVVDLSVLMEIGDAVYIRDIPLPTDVELVSDPDEILVLITAPAAIEEEEVVEEEVLLEEEPEVIERGKREEDEEGEGESTE